MMSSYLRGKIGLASGAGFFDIYYEKMKKLIPSETQDRIAAFILFILLPLGFLFEIFVVLPNVHEVISKGWLWRVSVLGYFGISGFINVYNVIRMGPNGRTSDLPALLKPGYRYCYNCQLNEPPRSHHCPVCDKCAFRRDHHCSFVARCIGHFNQRYYMSAIFNFWIVSITTMSWNWSLASEAVGGFTLLQMWQLIVPHLALLLRILSFPQFLQIMIFIFSFTVFLFLTYLIGAQLFCIYRGQTRVEFLLDVHAYNLGFVENLRQALGYRWLLALFVPFVKSPLTSDGLSFPTKESRPMADMKTM